jgi:zinc transporter, ZIP family
VSTAQILVLGAIAGLTIFIGLPIGRMRNVSPALKAFLTAVATGVLVFLFWDVVTAAIEPIESALRDGHDARFAGLSLLLTAGFAVGLLSLVAYDGWMKRQRKRSMLGPGAAATAEFETHGRGLRGLSSAQLLSVFIATGIGLHNFSEGLAIGQSAATGEIALAVALIVGFGLHNATEGFGIVAPLAGESELPSWGFLAALGVVGGGPTFLGTIVGQTWTSTALSVAFLALAAGSILYVVVELIGVCARLTTKQMLYGGLLLGLFLGFATDFVLVAAGA